MKTKKTLSIILAIMMILSSFPIISLAADPIALTEANVVEWPTVEYKTADGIYYYGQDVNTCLALVGGVVTIDGTAEGAVVPGKFEFNYATYPINGTRRAYIKFVPTDEEVYTGFSVDNTSNVTFVVTKTTPVFVDEVNDPVVSTKIEQGARLNTTTLSGGQMKNPYNNEVINASWSWSSSRTRVNESGYFEARFAGDASYNVVTAQVYVKIKENVTNTTIAEAPTVGELTYDASRTWADVELTGGKAVEEGTETEVAGTFAVTTVDGSKVLNNVVTVGTHEVTVTFTPDDTDKYISSTTTITVTVNKAVLKFRDENGNEVVPEYTIPYGYALNNYQAGIFEECKKYLNTGDENIRLYFSEEDSKTVFPVGTHELTIGAAPYYTTSNYLKNEELKVKITVEPVTITPAVKASTEGYYVEDNSGTYKVKGTFDVYVDGELYKSGVAYLEKVAYVPETSGTHEIKFVYNPVENDNFIIENEMTATLDINLTHSLTASDNILSGYGDFPYGSSIEIYANVAAEDFAGWKITDANGNEITLDGVDNSSTKITITMPDHDIHVEALEKSSSSGGGLEMPDLGDLELPDLELNTDGDHKFKFVNIIQNLIEMLKNFIKQIGQTIEGIL